VRPPLSSSLQVPATLLLAALLLAGCGGTNGASTPLPTVTPLGELQTVTPSASPTAAGPTAVAIDTLPEVQEARQHLLAGNYDRAVQLLRRVTASYNESVEVREELARAYQAWGHSLIDASGGDIAQVILGLEKFTNGLAAIPTDSDLQADLQHDHDNARTYVDAAVAQDVLNGNSADMDLAARRSEAERIRGMFEDLYDHSPTFPGLTQRYALALLAAGVSYSEGGESTAEKVSLRQQEQTYCEQALTINSELSEAASCAKDAADSITQLTATPTPVTATRAPSHLAMGRINQNERPGCISVQLRNVNAAGWRLTIDGMNLSAQFDGGNNSSLCGLPGNSVTFTIRNASGSPVAGGRGVPASGGDIFVGTWK
jgi:hypothetical protein